MCVLLRYINVLTFSAKLDELKQVIKVLEGQNSAMVKQLFNKDRTLIECQKHLLSTQEQLEKAKDKLEKVIGYFIFTLEI